MSCFLFSNLEGSRLSGSVFRSKKMSSESDNDAGLLDVSFYVHLITRPFTCNIFFFVLFLFLLLLVSYLEERSVSVVYNYKLICCEDDDSGHVFR